MRIYSLRDGVPYVCDFTTTTFSQLPDDYWPGVRTRVGAKNAVFVRNRGGDAPTLLVYNKVYASVYDTNPSRLSCSMSTWLTHDKIGARIISSACLTKRGIIMLVEWSTPRSVCEVSIADSPIRDAYLGSTTLPTPRVAVHNSQPYSHTADYYDGSFACLIFTGNQVSIYRDAGERCETTRVNRNNIGGAMVTYGPTAYIIDAGRVTMSDNRVDYYRFISKWDHLNPNVITSRAQRYAKALSETTIAIGQMPVYDGSYWGRMCMYDIRAPDSPLYYPDILIPPHIGGLTPTSWAFCPQK